MKVTKSGKRVPDTKHTSRALKRVLKTDSVFAPTYIADVTMWDTSADEKTVGKMAFLPIHEALEAVVPPNEEYEWASYTPAQNGFRLALREWAVRVGLALSTLANCLPIALWGDSAEFSHRQSLFLLEFQVLSGGCRKRFWICSFAKKSLCQCGCRGRCTMDDVWGGHRVDV